MNFLWQTAEVEEEEEEEKEKNPVLQNPSPPNLTNGTDKTSSDLCGCHRATSVPT